MKRLFLAVALSWIVVPAEAAHYATVHLEQKVERSADLVWSRIGPYCAIQDWPGLKCALTQGTGDVGTIRKLNGATDELMVGKTVRSYTYGQPASSMFYHGTLAVEALDAAHALIIYELVYDDLTLGTADEKAADQNRRRTRFQAGLEKMKQIAEAP